MAWVINAVLAVTVVITVVALWSFVVVKGHDLEQTRGLLVFLAVVAAIALAGVNLAQHNANVLYRVGASIVALVVAISLASANWKRGSLRWVAGIGLVLIALMLTDIGRSTLTIEAQSDALTELISIQQAGKQIPLKTATQLASERSKARENLDSAIQRLSAPAAGSAPPEAADLAVKEGLADTAAEVAVAIDHLNGPLRTERLARFNELWSTAGQVQLSPLIITLKSNLEALIEATDETVPTRDDLDASITDACVTARAAATGLPDKPACEGTASGVPLIVAMAQARLELAKLRARVFARAEDAAEVEAKTAALTAAQAAVITQPEPIAPVDALESGANTFINSIQPNEKELPLAATVLGWVVIALVALGFWRVVERRSARQSPGPVSVDLFGCELPEGTSPEAGEVLPSEDIQKTIFRTAVLQNLSEPAAVPGASALNSLTDLVELPGVPKSFFAPLITAVQNVINAPHGYNIIGNVSPPEKFAGGEWRVLVRIVDRATGEQVDVTSIRGATVSLACRAAGFWAAASVLGRSIRIASWARWDKGTAEALASFQDADDSDTAELQRAVALAPCSGVLLNKLACSYDLDKRPLEALSLYARAVAAHPRYPAARYRLAVSVAMLSRAVAENWLAVPWSERKRIAQQLCRACTAMNLWKGQVQDASRLTERPSQADVEKILQQLTTAMFRRLAWDTKRTGLIARAFRRSERDSWWTAGLTKFGRTGPRQKAHWLVISASLTARRQDWSGSAEAWHKVVAFCRLVDHIPAKQHSVERQARKYWSWWQLSYNLACFHCAHEQWDDALTWLERSLEHQGSWQMTGGWIDTDPDLAAIRQAPRFRWVSDQVHAKAKGAGSHG